MKTVFTLLILLISLTGFSQTEKQKIEQYCKVRIEPQLFSRNVVLEVDYGEWKRDKRLRDESDKVRSFETEVDALNFMAREGWKLVTVVVRPSRTGGEEYYLFKRKIVEE